MLSASSTKFTIFSQLFDFCIVSQSSAFIVIAILILDVPINLLSLISKLTAVSFRIRFSRCNFGTNSLCYNVKIAIKAFSENSALDRR